MNVSVVVILAIYLVASVFVAVRAGTLNRNIAGWFLLSMIASPLLGVPLLIMAGPSGKSCPQCKVRVPASAQKCNRCGRVFSAHEQYFERLKKAGVKLD